MCYLSDQVDVNRLKECLRILVFDDPGMREDSMDDVRKRVERTFSSDTYIRNLEGSRHNWLEKDVSEVIAILQSFLKKL